LKYLSRCCPDGESLAQISPYRLTHGAPDCYQPGV
jgi:hypothetical protein